ncbi:MAG: glycosyltransferase family 39 protein [Firmicutes bacterium]|nr:glycosyltransferase family 39 protein [Bacillota bacterium]
MPTTINIKRYFLPAAVLIAVLFMMPFIISNDWAKFIVLFSVLLAACIIIIVRTPDPSAFREKPPEEAGDKPGMPAVKFLLIIFITALIIRLVFMLMVHWNSIDNGAGGFFFKYVYARGSDDVYYDESGKAIAEAWKSGKLLQPQEIFLYRRSIHIGYNVFVAFIYYLCGYNGLFGKIINCLLGAMIPIFIYFIAWISFGAKPARLAAIICALDSYLMFFTGFLFKDVLIALLVVYSIWYFIKYTKTGNKWYLLIAVLAVAFEFINRTYAGASIGGAIFFYYIVVGAPKEPSKRLVYFAIFIVAASPFLYIFYKVAKMQAGSKVARVQGEGGGAEGAGLEEGRVFSPKRLAKNCMRIFVSPIPWRDLQDTWENVFYWVYPGKWLWYIFLPFFFVGIWHGIREKFRDVLVVGAVLVQYIGILIVIMQTAYRHQAPVMPLMIMTAAIGFCKVKNPLLVYLLYLPILIIFFFFDNSMFKEGLIITIIAFIITTGIILFTRRKEITGIFKNLFTEKKTA